MDSSPTPKDKKTFLSIVRDLKMIPDDVLGDISDEVDSSGDHPTQVILRKGLLDVAEIDIVETLLNPNETISDYEILDVLGKGGMGVVYRARQKSLNRIVAIKMVLLSQMKNPSLIARFEREAQTVAKLQHPHIVAAHDFGQHEGRLFFVMELVKGTDVEKLIRQQKQIPESIALGLTRQAAAGLMHATQMGIVHRDIKPANLLLVEPPAGYSLPAGLPMVKIADFGLAFLSDNEQTETRLTTENAALGSPHYMAPEQLGGDSIDHRADYYALGATLYHMLTGKPPFNETSLSKIITKKVKGEFTPVRELAPKVSKKTALLVETMMAYDANDRDADYQRLIEILDGNPAPKVNMAMPITLMDSTFESSADSSSQTNLETLLTNDAKDKLLQTKTSAFKNPTSKSYKKFLYPILFIACLGLFAFSIVAFNSKPTQQLPARNMVNSGWSKSLFDGKNLASMVINGSWFVGKDDEEASVIVGTNGLIRQPFYRTENEKSKPLENYRFTMFVRLNEAEALECHLGISPKPNQNGPRTVLRITPDQLALFKSSNDRTSNLNVEENHIAIRETKVQSDKLYQIGIERQHDAFFVFFNEEFLGAVSTKGTPVLSEVRIAVKSGPVWLSDFYIKELQEEKAEPNS